MPMTRYAWRLALCLCALSCGSAPEADGPARKPNFVVLLVDDWGWSDAGCLGSDLYQTPNIDALAAEGMRFTNGYAACTVCSPTRAALMTGQYPGRTRVTDFIRGHSFPNELYSPPDWTMKIEQRHTTLAEALRSAGYRTAIVGKWHLEPTGEADEDDYSPEKHGFEINVGGNEWGAPATYFHPYAKEGSPRVMGPLPPGGKEGDYLTDRLTDEALKILDGWGDEPFLLYFPYYTVHTPIEAKPELLARFEPLVKPGMRHQDPSYAAMVASLDESIGRLRAKLQELGVADNTVILLAGDNGGLDQNGAGRPTENAPLREGKGSAYEGGVRTPTIIHWPGVTQAGAVSAEPVITVDLYPTVLEIAGAQGDPEHNAQVDGVSLTPLLRDPRASLNREALYWHYPHNHSGGATPHSAIRAGDWRLVEFYEGERAELYNGRRRGRDQGPPPRCRKGRRAASQAAGVAREGSRPAARAESELRSEQTAAVAGGLSCGRRPCREMSRRFFLDPGARSIVGVPRRSQVAGSSAPHPSPPGYAGMSRSLGVARTAGEGRPGASEGSSLRDDTAGLTPATRSIGGLQRRCANFVPGKVRFGLMAVQGSDKVRLVFTESGPGALRG